MWKPFFFGEKGQNVTLAGKNAIAPHNRLGSKISIEQLLKFYTTTWIEA